VVVVFGDERGADVRRRGLVRLYDVPPSGTLRVEEATFEPESARRWFEVGSRGKEVLIRECAGPGELKKERCIWAFRAGRFNNTRYMTRYMAFSVGPTTAEPPQDGAADEAIVQESLTSPGRR
jgi:hypothetical protein